MGWSCEQPRKCSQEEGAQPVLQIHPACRESCTEGPTRAWPWDEADSLGGLSPQEWTWHFSSGLHITKNWFSAHAPTPAPRNAGDALH